MLGRIENDSSCHINTLHEGKSEDRRLKTHKSSETKFLESFESFLNNEMRDKQTFMRNSND
ncbi:CLUMA_CG003177, isoform A [Clunio marinus]|uniref:CLUMA_CG003177, isoform A n=1 Tax=Clunio marinus TaxID=568069 RepID=A0A1J1HPV7_9DIPT|nr:CLUMA_CG003177, isoform A [Clunio marinus]